MFSTEIARMIKTSTKTSTHIIAVDIYFLITDSEELFISQIEMYSSTPGHLPHGKLNVITFNQLVLLQET